MGGKSAMLYKTLVVGVIVLFIGIGIQPAIATIENNPIEKDDDCDICPAIKIISNLIDKEDYQKLSDYINEELDNGNIYKSFKTKSDNKIICDILFLILQYYVFRQTLFTLFSSPLVILLILLSSSPFDNLYNLIDPIISYYGEIRILKFMIQITYVYDIGREKNCSWVPPLQN